MRRPWLATAVSIVVAGCGSGGPGHPTMGASSPVAKPTPAFVLAAPVPLRPEPGAAVFQNDPANGCEFDRSWGYGLYVEYAWTRPASSAGVAAYQLHVQNRDAEIPALDQRVVGETFVERSCHSYVIDTYLDGWEWRVRAIDRDGTLGPWSAITTFRYWPCRIGNRRCGT